MEAAWTSRRPEAMGRTVRCGGSKHRSLVSSAVSEATVEPRRVRIGTLDAGPVGAVVDGSVLAWGDVTVRWWLRGPHRWHDPESDPTRRVASVDGTPVERTQVRLPGGDVTVTVGAVVGGERGGARAVIEIANPSADPIGAAFVLESRRPMRLDASVASDGVVELRTERPARASAAAAGVAELGELFAAAEPSDLVAGEAAAGVVALVVPVPHGAVVRAAVGAAVVSDPAPVFAAFGEGGSRLAAGWRRQLAELPRVEWSEPVRDRRWSELVADALLGPDESGVPTEELAAAVVALGRLGALDLADRWMERLLGRAAAGGVVRGGGDEVAATASLLEVAAALWRGGLEAAPAAQLLGPVGAAVAWLTARRRREAVAARADAVAEAMADVVPFLLGVAQPELAEEVARAAGDLGWRGGSTPVGPAGGHPVLGSLDAAVAETVTGIDIGRGWDAGSAGRPVEVHGVPTRFGRVSWALRWHGARPAVLYEVVPWPGRPSPTPPRWTASAVDPTWQAQGFDGDALLEVPSAVVDGGT